MTADKKHWHAAVAEGLAERGCHCDPPGSGEEHCTGHCLLRRERDELRSALKDQVELNNEWSAANDELRAKNERLRGEVADLLPRMDADAMTITTLARENERLRAALEEYVSRHPCSHQIRCWSDERARAMLANP